MTTMIAAAEREGLAPEGLRSLRVAGPLTVATAPDLLEASRVIDRRRRGSLTVRVNPVVIRAREHTGTLTAFNICNG